MRHHLKHRKLQRTASHRRALLANMAQALFEHEQITTTLPKAKELRPYAERLITLAKRGKQVNRRQLEGILYRSEIVTKLVNVLAPRFEGRHGGYTRVVKAGFRTGDNAPMAIIELVDRDAKAKGLADREFIAEQKRLQLSEGSDA